MNLDSGNRKIKLLRWAWQTRSEWCDPWLLSLNIALAIQLGLLLIAIMFEK